MTTVDRTRRAVLLGTPALLLGAPACRTDSKAASEEGAPRPLTPDERRSLATLRLVDARLPLFAMTLHGPYDPMRKVAAAVAERPWGCSLFLAGKGPRGPLFGRNFDWDPNPGLLLRTASSISFVDISYLGIDQPAAKRLMGDVALRRKLLQAVALPFDGMNAHGLAVGMAAVPGADPPKPPGRPVVNSGRIMRLVLDQARTVDEAVKVFRRYPVDFSLGGPPLHYLLADARGKAVAVEFVGGKIQIIPGSGDWHDLVNFVLSGASETVKREDGRYRKIAERLQATGGRLDPGGAMDLLEAVAQGHTRWSAVYELRHGSVRVALARDYAKLYSFGITA